MRDFLLLWTIIASNLGIYTDAATDDRLYKAAGRGDLAKVKELAGDQCTDVNRTIGYAWTPLHTAARESHTEVIKFLLTCNANPNMLAYNGLTETQGWTPLMMAARYGDLNTTNALLDYGGVEIDKQDEEGKTALYHATRNNRQEQVLTLLRHGANKNIKSKKGQTASEIARRERFIDIRRLIKYYNASTSRSVPVSVTTPVVPTSITFDDNITTDARVEGGLLPEIDNNIALSPHTLLMLVIIFGVLIFIVVISMICGCIYFRHKLSHQNSGQQQTVVYNNAKNRDSLHIYDN